MNNFSDIFGGFSALYDDQLDPARIEELLKEAIENMTVEQRWVKFWKDRNYE